MSKNKHYAAFVSLLLVIVISTTLSAQSGSSLISESSAGNYFGIGARAVGMSEAVVVSVMDGTAIVYNPAGLVRIKRPELFGALSQEQVKEATGSADNNFRKTRLNGLDLSVPVPTYRGSLVVAFGVNRTKSFDRTFTYDYATSSAVEEAMGGINEWSAAGAIELSPRLAVGATLTYYHGSEDYSWNFNAKRLEPGDTPYQNLDNINSRYSAIGARLGMTMEPNPYLTLGLTLDAPTRYNIKQDYVLRTITAGNADETVGNYEYDLQHPFIFNGGAAVRIKTLLLEADLGYADWSQLEYKGGTDLDSLNQLLQKAYTDAFQYRFGAELTIPQYSLVLRGGFKHDPLPISGIQIYNQIEKNRNSFSFGMGFLVDRLVMLDIAYAHANYTIFDGNRNQPQKYTSDRVLASIGYRI